MMNKIDDDDGPTWGEVKQMVIALRHLAKGYLLNELEENVSPDPIYNEGQKLNNDEHKKEY